MIKCHPSLFFFHFMSDYFHAYFQELWKHKYIEKSTYSSTYLLCTNHFTSSSTYLLHVEKWSKQIYIIMWKCAIKYYTQFSLFFVWIMYKLMILYSKYFKVSKVQEHFNAFTNTQLKGDSSLSTFCGFLKYMCNGSFFEVH